MVEMESLGGTSFKGEDPEGGIRVRGGHALLHRGTKKDKNGRSWIYAWIQRSHDSACKQTEWFQFMWVTMTVDDVDQTESLRKKKLKIVSKNGSLIPWGEWGPDFDHKYAEQQEKDAKKNNAKPPPAVSPQAGATGPAKPLSTASDPRS